MSSDSKNPGWFGPEGFSFFFFIAGWFPLVLEKLDQYRHGIGEDTAFGDVLAGLWLVVFLLVGLALALYALAQAEKRRQSPALAFLVTLLNAGSILGLVLFLFSTI